MAEPKLQPPSWDSSRKTWSENVAQTRGVAEDTTEAYLQWLLVHNFEQVRSRFIVCTEREQREILDLVSLEAFPDAPFIFEMVITGLDDKSKEKLQESLQEMMMKMVVV